MCLGEEFDVEGFDYDEDEYGDFEDDKKAVKSAPTKKPELKTTAKPSGQDNRPKRLVKIRKGNSLDPRFRQLVIDEEYYII